MQLDIRKYNAANLDQLIDRITRNSIGMDEYFDRIFKQQEASNYPPYNLIQTSETESILELALAGFKKKEVNVYTEDGKLYVEGKRESEKEGETNYLHRGVAQRSFTRAWTLSEDTEVRSVSFEDGLLVVELGKVIPEAHKRKNWF